MPVPLYAVNPFCVPLAPPVPFALLTMTRAQPVAPQEQAKSNG